MNDVEPLSVCRSAVVTKAALYCGIDATINDICSSIQHKYRGK